MSHHDSVDRSHGWGQTGRIQSHHSREVEVEAGRRVVHNVDKAENQEKYWDHQHDKDHPMNRSSQRSALNRSLPFMVDVDHRAPWMHAKDYTLLMLFAWLPVILSCVVAQYVADIFLYFGFMAVCYSLMLGLWKCMGANFDWGYFMKRDNKRSSKQTGLAVFMFVFVYMAVWGTATLIVIYVNYNTMAGHTSPTPNMDATMWKQVLYWIGVHLMALWLGYVETCFFNVLYDNACSGHYLMRMWASLAWAACWWCFLNNTFNGPNSWFWALMCTIGAWVFQLMNFACYDCCSMIGALTTKTGAYCGYALIVIGFYYSFFEWSLFQATFNYDPNNLFMI